VKTPFSHCGWQDWLSLQATAGLLWSSSTTIDLRTFSEYLVVFVGAGGMVNLSSHHQAIQRQRIIRNKRRMVQPIAINTIKIIIQCINKNYKKIKLISTSFLFDLMLRSIVYLFLIISSH
jgi:hypothetical protein